MVEDDRNVNETMKGWLLKWTNYVKGYRRRWFVLSTDKLSYYRKPTEAEYAQRGTINILEALIHTYNTSSFIVSSHFNIVFYLKAATQTERNDWVEALERGKSWAIAKKELESKSPEKLQYTDLQRETTITLDESLANYLESFQKYNTVIAKRGTKLKQHLSPLLTIQEASEIHHQKKIIQESVVLFQTTSDILINASKAYFDLALVKCNVLQGWLKDEINQRISLEETVEKILALHLLLINALTKKDDSTLQKIQNFTSSVTAECNTLKYNDICCSSKEFEKSQPAYMKDISQFEIIDGDSVLSSSSFNQTNPNDVFDLSAAASMFSTRKGFKVRKPRTTQRRTRIPDKPNRPLSLWGIMKNCIGKDLSRIPMPVNFSEPLSLLQRVAEDFTYSNLLDQAALCNDSCEQLAYLAAFTVSSYSTTAYRTAKPFNPLLGETYEWDRSDDLGWRLISEQVSHHPPIAAQHVESQEWTCWQEFAMTSKFRGKYLMIVPLGISHIVFHDSGNHYSWTKVTTTINNIIIGKLWVDNSGQMEIVNHKDSSKCLLNFLPYSMFRSEDQKKISGEVRNGDGQVKWIVDGKWDSEVIISPVISVSGKPDRPDYKTGNPKMVWKAIGPPEDSDKYYNFNLFTCQLNDIEEGVAPTDSRNRPDQRLMEEGKWDEANIVKTNLEEKQRTTRHQRDSTQSAPSSASLVSNEDEHSNVNYEPIWFKMELDVTTGRLTYIYKGGYWESKEAQEWGRCPNIYL